jgi:pimeloyl-ACP methyl ester carboxylesterase
MEYGFRHEFLANPAAANDFFYSVQAAQSAWPDELSRRFVMMAHSQGGGAAWAAAERQAQTPIEGYLGSVVVNPVTNLTLINQLIGAPAYWPFFLGYGMNQVFPTFSLSEWFTPLGLKYFNLLAEVLGGCSSTTDVIAGVKGLVKGDWANSSHAQQVFALLSVGGRQIAGPMLVLEGTMDSLFPVTDAVVNATCTAFPESGIECAIFEGMDLVPTLFTSQTLWLDWIWQRFTGEGVVGGNGCKKKLYSRAKDVNAYQAEPNYHLEFETKEYELSGL